MKKLLAILLALMLVLVNVAALADEGDEGGDNQNPSSDLPSTPNADAVLKAPIETPDENGATAFEPKVKKTYTIKDGLEFQETLSFEVKCTSVPTKDGLTTTNAPMITIGSNNTATNFTVGSIPADDVLDITFPEYNVPGIYEYEITETAGNVQGETYSSETIHVKVYVEYLKDSNTFRPSANVWVTTEKDGQKSDEITNVYDVGELTVDKVIDGNLADPEKEFSIEVVFTKAEGKTVKTPISYKVGENTQTIAANALDGGAQTVTLKLKGGESVKFENIPVGVTYSVKETGITDIDGSTITQLAKLADPDAYAIVYTTTGGTATNNDTNDDGVTGTISTTASTATITNTKEMEVPTGITLDFVPYVMIIALAGIALVAMKARKKEN